MQNHERDYRELLASEGRLRAFMHHSPILAFMKDDQGRYVYVNPRMEGTFHIRFEDIEGKADMDWLPESTAHRVRENDREVLETGQVVESLETIPTPDGTVRHWMVLKFPFTQPDGRRFVGGVAVDVTALKQAQLQLGESERRYRHLVESGQGLISTHDMEGTLLSANPAVLQLLGYSAAEVIGHNLRDLLSASGREQFHRYLERINHGGSDSGLMLMKAKNGEERTWQYHNVTVTEGDQPPYVLGYAQDVTELREAQEYLKTLSLTDELTGLHNRRGFFTMAARMLRAAPRSGQEFTVAYVDIDGLKAVNDTYGHEAGSALIAGAADVLKNTFRAADVVARMGGDEFVIIAAISRAGAGVITDRLEIHLSSFNARSELPYKLSLSVGLAHLDPNSPATLEDVVRQADQAMYEEKRSKGVTRNGALE